MASEHVARIRDAHENLARYTFEPAPLQRGYSNRVIRIDVGKNSMEILPVTQQMKDLWIGGKGFDLWLMLQEIDSGTRWDSPENPICFSSGPLGGTTSFPGAGKTLVTAISPLTDSIMDCNVGGYLGPYLKFAGFDALEIVGKASDEVVVVIDGSTGEMSIDRAPLESIDSHLLAEELTEMYAVNEHDKRNVTVVSAGRAADHVRMGVLNVSFYDWRRGIPRFKQAGRGGVGTVFRDKKIKALVVKAPESPPPWKVAENKVASHFASDKLDLAAERTDREAVRAIVRKWNCDPEYAIEMMQDVQDLERCISMAAVDEVSLRTGVSKARLYHIATFYKAFSLEPRGETIIQVCVGTTCHVKGAARLLETFERELDISEGGTTPDGRFSLDAVACLGCCSLAPVVKLGDEVIGNVQSKQIARMMKKQRSN
ncbi:MAG: NAD(P)H-dependent oxidoreductase subunit E [Deltaproteobacteria bacterium]|nr:NAD(P)H-dependent oxidoreductase subunit E [Deltaproteobacteria bacterium]